MKTLPARGNEFDVVPINSGMFKPWQAVGAGLL
jgi:hypothetical protein